MINCTNADTATYYVSYEVELYFFLLFVRIMLRLNQTRCTRGVRIVFSEQECDLVVVLVSINLTSSLRKSCSVHMTVFLKLLFNAMLTNEHNH